MKIIHHHFEYLTSTNDKAKDCLNELPEKNSLFLITAEGQSAARGQYGRSWLSPKGVNLYATFAFFAPQHLEAITFTRLLALSTKQLLENMGLTCMFKRPNDLLINKKKIAGILCETIPQKDMQGIVIGIGLNINMSAELLQTIDQPATSLLYETGQKHDIKKILSELEKIFLDEVLSQRF